MDRKVSPENNNVVKWNDDLDLDVGPKDPLNILPVELWEEIILKNLFDHPSDLLSCSKSCSLWQSILLPHRTTYLFHFVFPSIFNYLSKDDIFNCLLVCKSWSNSIANFLAKDQHKIDHDPYSATSSKPRKLEIDFNLIARSRHSTLSQVLTHFNDQFSDRLIHLKTAKNPFLSRSVHLTVGPFDFPHVLHFLESFGPFIWSLNLRLPSMNDNHYPSPCRSLHYTMYIWKILQSIPNIQRLQLSISWTQTLSGDPNQRLSEVAALQEYIQNYSPPPKLKDLKVVHFEESGPTVLKCILENWYASQLSAIHYSELVPNDLGDNLEYLSLQMSGPLWNDQIEAFQRFGRTRNLKMLYLYIFDEGDPYLDNLFEAISHSLASSLQVLIIQWRRGKQHFPDKLHLPYLKCLELRDLIPGEEPCLKTALEFLADLKELRCLKIQWSYQTYQSILLQKAVASDVNDDKIDLLQHVDKLDYKDGGRDIYKSNIWHKLPKLDKITMKTWDIREEPSAAEWNKIYTRWEWSKVYTRELFKQSDFLK